MIRRVLRWQATVVGGLGLLLLAVPATAHAEVMRVELHPFVSATLSDRQFLQGSQAGERVTLAGELRLPHDGTERLPAVILLHGSGGVSGFVDDWARWLNDLGVATFLVDSFTGRGLDTVLADQFRLGRLAMIVDAYRAVELLERHPRIDAERMLVVGFSRGGQAALYASVERFQRGHLRSKARPVGYVAFYPDCSTRYRDDEVVVDAPIRVFHGAADDFNPVAACRRYVDRLQSRGADAELVVYPGAHHAFDWPRLQPLVRLAQAQSVRRCRLEEDAAATIRNAETGLPFASDDPCIERGASLAYAAEAHVDVQRRLREFLSAALGLRPSAGATRYDGQRQPSLAGLHGQPPQHAGGLDRR